MTEKEWVLSIINDIENELRRTDNNLRASAGHRLSYANEILSYNNSNEPITQNSLGYETDILIFEQIDEVTWKPRIIIETKVGSVTTHDAITYSEKASKHKYVHPFLRYGILVSRREDYPLPGRLFRNGQNFDFMLSWKTYEADENERLRFFEILHDEINASKQLEEILFNSRKKNREKYTILHRPLRLE
jgi:hypothetical protein